MTDELKKIEEEILECEKKLSELRNKRFELKNVNEIETLKNVVGKYFSQKHEGGGGYKLFKCTGCNIREELLTGEYISAQEYLIGKFDFYYTNDMSCYLVGLKKEFVEVSEEKYYSIRNYLLKNITKDEV